MNASRSVLRRTVNWVIIIGVGLALPGFIFQGAFELLFAPIDAVICAPGAASRVGAAPSFNAIEQFISENVTKGTSRVEVNAILSRLGPLQIYSDAGFTPTTSLDSVTINMCLDPLNDPNISVQYTASGQVIDMQFNRYE